MLASNRIIDSACKVLIALAFSCLAWLPAKAQLYNDGGIRLKVWVNSVYSGANCIERTPIPFINSPSNRQKYVFSNVRVRAANPNPGTFRTSQPLAFNVQGDYNNAFHRASNFRFFNFNDLLNPPEVAWGDLPLVWRLLQSTAHVLEEGTTVSNDRGILIFNETFANTLAPDRFEWSVENAWENDCNFAGGDQDSPDPLCRAALIGLSYGYLPACFCQARLLPEICIPFIGCTPPLDVPWPEDIIGLNGGNGDDNRAQKGAFTTDPVRFRSGPPGVINYHLTDPEQFGSGANTYAIVFAYEWEFVNEPAPCNNTANGNQSFANPGGNQIDGPVELQVWFDGIFSASDYDGNSNCFSFFNISAVLGGDENLRVRWNIRDNLQAAIPTAPFVIGTIGGPGGELRQPFPRWTPREVPMMTRQYCDYPCGPDGIGFNSFQVRLQAWEEDGCGPDDAFNTSNCDFGSLFSGGLSNDQYFANYLSPDIMWRNSPPETDNFWYAPINISTSQYAGWFGRIRYRWRFTSPLSATLLDDADVELCKGAAGQPFPNTIVINANTTGATYMQWQFSNWSGPGDCPPADAQWFDLQPATGILGARCENLQLNAANIPDGTRYYRLKVFNRNGLGSRTSSGDRFDVAYSECKRITVPRYIPPFTSNFDCSKDPDNPVRIGGGTTVTFRVAQVPDTLAVAENASVTYTWTVRRSGATCSPSGTTVATFTGPIFVYTFPTSPLDVCYNVQLTVTTPCGTTNSPDRCYIFVTDPECGPIYVSRTIGSPSNTTATKLAPLNSLSTAMLLLGPGRRHVKIEGSLSDIDTIFASGSIAMNLIDSAIIDGGYFITPEGEWVKDGRRTIIKSSIREVINDTIAHIIGFKADGTNGWLIQDIDLFTRDASELNATNCTSGQCAGATGNGISNYGLLAINSTGFQLINARFNAGNAGQGRNSPIATPARDERVGSMNGTAASGGTPVGVLPAEFGCATVELPGAGGNPNQSGSPGSQGIGLGPCPGSSGCGGVGTTSPANNGRNGAEGNPGLTLGIYTNSDLDPMPYYIPRSGTTGQCGAGGGGGAGNASAGGGAGGRGGRGGTPGGGGGGAFGIFMHESSGGIRNSVFTAGAAGDGSTGRDGQLGMLGGDGLSGSGNGGNGGRGGAGGAGQLGRSIASFINIGSSLTTLGASYPVAPNPAHIKSDYVAGCTNSLIELNRTQGTAWVPVSGAQIAALTDPRYALDPANNINSNKLLISTPATGRFNIAYSGGSAPTFFNYVHITLDRVAPVFTGIPDTICDGNPIFLDANPNPYAIATEFRWDIQRLPNDPPCLPNFSCLLTDTLQNRIATFVVETPGNFTFPPTGGSVQRYVIRYSTRDICCGWSPPIYKFVTIVPEITQEIEPNSPQDLNICVNASLSGPLRTKGSIVGGVAPLEYQWLINVDTSTAGVPATGFLPIAGATAVTYNPSGVYFDLPGIYEFVRIVRSSVAGCDGNDSSNVIRIVVEPGIDNNLISDPNPLIADGCFTTLNVNGGSSATLNIGLIQGSVPSVPGGQPVYQWQRLNGNPAAWVNVLASSENGTSPTTQNYDPGAVSYVTPNGYWPVFNCGSETDLERIDSLKRPYFAQFRRIVTKTGCIPDTSNVVSALVENNARCLFTDSSIEGVAEVCPGVGTITLRMIPPNFVDSIVTVDGNGDTTDIQITGRAGSGYGEEIRWFRSTSAANAAIMPNPFTGNNLSASSFNRNLTVLGRIEDTGLRGEFITIPAPTETTEYYANWFGKCDVNLQPGDANLIRRFLVKVQDTCVCESSALVRYARDGMGTVADVECEDGSWTWYANELATDTVLYAIEKKPTTASGGVFTNANTNNFRATVNITVNSNPTTQAAVYFAEDVATCEATFVMPRYWNVSVDSGSIDVNSYVNTRFFYRPAELSATYNRAVAWLANQVALNNAACDNATVGPPQVFKTTDGTPFNPAVDIEPTTINGRRYFSYLLSQVAPSYAGLPAAATGQTIQGLNYVSAAWQGFSGGGISIRVSPDTSVLPVTLLYFTGSLVDDEVHLDWETASELNNDFFEVQKSLDGVTWFKLGIVPGNGTTSIPQKYSLIDPNPVVGNNYYRLKQVDFDGAFEFSRIINVVVGDATARTGFIELYPNPTSGPAIASISSLTDQNVYLKVTDMLGRMMENRQVNLARGLNNLNLDITKYPAGAYIISFTDQKGEEHNFRLMKQ